MSQSKTYDTNWAAPVLSSNTNRFPYFYLTNASYWPNSSLLFLNPWPEKWSILGVYKRIGLKFSIVASSFQYLTAHYVSFKDSNII